MSRGRSGWTGLCDEYCPLAAGSIDGTDEQPHDRGIIRAMNATYKPNKAVVGDPHCTVFVSRLHPKTTEKKLHEVFSRFGDIKRMRLVRDLVTGFSKRYAFIEYEDSNSADEAQRKGYQLIIDDVEIFVDFELERSLKGWVPRRLGGGFGGKKESGQLRFGGKDRPFRQPIVVADKSNRQDRLPPWKKHDDNRNSKEHYYSRDRDRSEVRKGRRGESRDWYSAHDSDTGGKYRHRSDYKRSDKRTRDSD